MRRLGLFLILVVAMLAGCARSVDDQLVGVWTAQTKESKIPTLPFPGMDRQVDQFVNSFVLKLRSDHTFVLPTGPGAVEGKWSVSGSSVVLKPNKDKLPSALGDEVGEMKGKLSEDRSRITLEQSSPFGTVSLVLKKTA